MKSEELSQSFLRKRKMMMVLPLLVIPFLTMAFWALGGGQGKAVSNQEPITGLNLKLPDPKLREDRLLDKLSFYDKADKDSMKMAEWMRSDPYYKAEVNGIPSATTELEKLTVSTASKYSQNLNLSPFDQRMEKPEEEIMRKLSLLQAELNKAPTSSQDKNSATIAANLNDPQLAENVDRLADMMNDLNKGNTDDPEIRQLSSVMDKILDIQHPERVKERANQTVLPPERNILTVSSTAEDDSIVSGFYGLETEPEIHQSDAIEAVVNEEQVLVNGSIIKLRLLNTIYIKGWQIPLGNFVYGMVSLEGERLNIEINSIRNGSLLYPVKMIVFDMDGLPGIYIPGAITRDVAKQSTDNALQMMELSTLDPSIKAQATAAGISTMKSMLSKKVKQVKVVVKAGYKVLLNDLSNSK